MRLLTERSVAVLVIGMLSSLVLLSYESLPPSVSVEQIWALEDDCVVSVHGLLVHFWMYDSGAESLVIADETSPRTVKVVCEYGPGAPPSSRVSIGDQVSVSGECAFQVGGPVVFCHFGDVTVLSPCQEALTVEILGRSWYLYEGDRISLVGETVTDPSGTHWLVDTGGEGQAAIRLSWEVEIREGPVSVDCVVRFDVATMSVVLDVVSITAATPL